MSRNDTEQNRESPGGESVHELIRNDLLERIESEAEKDYLGEIYLEGWQVGLYDPKLDENGEVEWCVTEKAVELIESGEIREYLERERRGIEITPSMLRDLRDDRRDE